MARYRMGRTVPVPPQEQRIESLLAEGLIGVSVAAELMGKYRAGRPCHPSTVSRWCTAGVKLGGGRVVRLVHLRVAGRLMTSRPAMVRFLSAQSAPE